MNILTFAKEYPTAFAALPSCYQNDSCLFFWEEEGVLYAKPDVGQEVALGYWVASYLADINSWHVD